MGNVTAFTKSRTRKFIDLRFLIGGVDGDAAALDYKDCPFIVRGIPRDRIEEFELHAACVRTCKVVIRDLAGNPVTHLVRGTPEDLVNRINSGTASPKVSWRWDLDGDAFGHTRAA